MITEMEAEVERCGGGGRRYFALPAPTRVIEGLRTTRLDRAGELRVRRRHLMALTAAGWFLLAGLAGCRSGDGASQPRDERAVRNRTSEGSSMESDTLTLSSIAFTGGTPIPVQYTCDGQDLSPPLRWADVPDGTQSFALIVHDPDAPRGDFTHWVLFDIPAEVRELREGMPEAEGGVPGANDFGRIGYGGPCPPPHDHAHRYFFQLYALNVPSLDLERGAGRADVEYRIREHILARGQLIGTYQRTRRVPGE